MTNPTPERASGDRRLNSRIANIVASALRLSNAKGRVQAWHYLRLRCIPTPIALRALSTRGPRRVTDLRPEQSAFTVPGTNADGTAQRSVPFHVPAREEPVPMRRMSQVTEAICERAVGALSTDSHEYAESLLRMYSLKTTTIMRVLYQPGMRRRKPGSGRA